MRPKNPMPLFFSRPDLICLILLIVSIVVGVFLPVVKFVYSPYAYLGIAPIVLGVVLSVWADALFKRNKTTVKPHERPLALMTSGPFRISRNPMYLGMMAILFGIAVCVGSLSAFVSPLIFFLVSDFRFIPLEESVMENVFGMAYVEYKGRVRRWI